MRKIIIIAAMLCASVRLSAQQKIGYTYDTAGNRTGSFPIFLRMQNNEDSQENQTNRMMDRKYQVFAAPNPTRGYIQVQISGLEDGDICTLSLFDGMGRKVLSQETKRALTTLDLTTLSNGLYLLCADVIPVSARSQSKKEELATIKIIKGNH